MKKWEDYTNRAYKSRSPVQGARFVWARLRIIRWCCKPFSSNDFPRDFSTLRVCALSNLTSGTRPHLSHCASILSLPSRALGLLCHSLRTGGLLLDYHRYEQEDVAPCAPYNRARPGYSKAPLHVPLLQRASTLKKLGREKLRLVFSR